MSVLENHFPGLRQDTAAQQDNQIFGTLRRMVDQQQAQYVVKEISKEEKSTTSVVGWIREDNFPVVINLIHTRNEADLIVACPA